MRVPIYGVAALQVIGWSVHTYTANGRCNHCSHTKECTLPQYIWMLSYKNTTFLFHPCAHFCPQSPQYKEMREWQPSYTFNVNTRICVKMDFRSDRERIMLKKLECHLVLGALKQRYVTILPSNHSCKIILVLLSGETASWFSLFALRATCDFCVLSLLRYHSCVRLPGGAGFQVRGQNRYQNRS